jgi:lipopolysaccharide biosynthesis regulator YciM
VLQGWPLTFGAGVALLVLGILVGRALTLAVDRRKGRGAIGEQPHYLLGLNYLISNQPDLAMVELSQAVRGETDAIEAYLALGNLFREKGQVERAIDIHKSLLHRAHITELGRMQALFSLGLDFKKAGLVDRAERTLLELVRRDPENLSGWHCLGKVYEEMGRWQDAIETQQRIQSLSGATDDRLLASLWTQRGRQAFAEGDHTSALSHFRTALGLDAAYEPARIGAGDCLMETGDTDAALAQWEEALGDDAAWAGDALLRMLAACEGSESLVRLDRLDAACSLVLDRHPRSWRAMWVQARLHHERGEDERSREALTKALFERPGSLTVQRALWQAYAAENLDWAELGGLLDRAGREAKLVDPYVCLRCGFKSTQAFPRCPHCHEWNTLAEEQA